MCSGSICASSSAGTRKRCRRRWCAGACRARSTTSWCAFSASTATRSVPGTSTCAHSCSLAHYSHLWIAATVFGLVQRAKALHTHSLCPCSYACVNIVSLRPLLRFRSQVRRQARIRQGQVRELTRTSNGGLPLESRALATGSKGANCISSFSECHSSNTVFLLLRLISLLPPQNYNILHYKIPVYRGKNREAHSR